MGLVVVSDLKNVIECMRRVCQETRKALLVMRLEKRCQLL